MTESVFLGDLVTCRSFGKDVIERIGAIVHWNGRSENCVYMDQRGRTAQPLIWRCFLIGTRDNGTQQYDDEACALHLKILEYCRTKEGKDAIKNSLARPTLRIYPRRSGRAQRRELLGPDASAYGFDKDGKPLDPAETHGARDFRIPPMKMTEGSARHGYTGNPTEELLSYCDYWGSRYQQGLAVLRGNRNQWLWLTFKAIYGDDKSPAQLSKEWGKPEVTIRSWLSRAHHIVKAVQGNSDELLDAYSGRREVTPDGDPIPTRGAA